MKLLAVSGDVRFPKEHSAPQVSEGTKEMIKNCISTLPEERYSLDSLTVALDENFECPIDGRLYKYY